MEKDSKGLRIPHLMSSTREARDAASCRSELVPGVSATSHEMSNHDSVVSPLSIRTTYIRIRLCAHTRNARESV